MGNALAKLSEEDPTFRVHTDEDSGQTVIEGMGELHLEIICDRLKREFKVECHRGQPQVAYKEAIFSSTDHREVYKKVVVVAVSSPTSSSRLGPSPTPEEEGLVFKNSVKGGNVPKEFVPSVEKGFKDAMVTGVLAGYPMDSMSVELVDGSFHGRPGLALLRASRQNGVPERSQELQPQILESAMSPRFAPRRRTWVMSSATSTSAVAWWKAPTSAVARPSSRQKCP